MTLADSCLLCGSRRLLPAVRFDHVPVLCNQLWPDKATAKDAPRGQIDLVACSDCGLLFNRAFDDSKMGYAPGYENSLHFSSVFRRFARDLALDLIERHALSGKCVVEIGCGDGYFLDLVTQNGVAFAVGYDPSAEPLKSDKTEIVAENFVPERIDEDVAAIVCRHVLEHLPDPLGLLLSLRQAIGSNPCTLYFEVPNAEWMMNAGSVWDVIYEHVTYWTRPAIETLFRVAGFEPIAVRTGFGNQFLMIDAVPAKSSKALDHLSTKAETTIAMVETFGASARAEISQWRNQLAKSESQDTVIWGAGSKGIMFANAVSARGLSSMVDVNPRKRGLAVPLVGLPIAAPDDLTGKPPRQVLISNRQYESEIKDTLASLGLSPSLGFIAS